MKSFASTISINRQSPSSFVCTISIIEMHETSIVQTIINNNNNCSDNYN